MSTKTDNLVKARAAKKKNKKINTKIIAKATADSQVTRAYQERFDNRFQLVVYKYNKFDCHDCKTDINIVGLMVFSDPKSGRQFINLHKTCNVSCNNNNQIYEIEPIDKEELDKDGIKYFSEY